MIPKEILKKVRQIEITTSRLVSDIFAGQYHSVFKGQGIEFEEVREYQVGDDIRTIDWNVTARTGRPHVKKFVEERELTAMILVDASPSTRFGSRHALKSQLAAEIAALLALSAIRNNDKVGLIIFTDTIEKYIPPRKGRNHVLRVIREILYFEPQGRGTDLTEALDYLNRVTNRRSITFLISDFLDIEDKDKEYLKRKLGVADKRHDVIALCLNDPFEQRLPRAGIFALEDAETGRLQYLDASDSRVRLNYEERNKARLLKREQFFRSLGIDFIDISTEESYTEPIIRFFRRRRHLYR